MSTCEQIRDLMPLLSEDELPQPEAALASAHIDSCAPCQKAFAAFTEMDSILTAGKSRWRPARWVALAAAVLLTLSVAQRKPAPTQEHPFIEIPYLAPLAANESTTVVRTEVQVSALLAAGYRVAAEPEVVVPLDMLLGEDGRAHAVRVLSDVEVKGL